MEQQPNKYLNNHTLKNDLTVAGICLVSVGLVAYYMEKKTRNKKFIYSTMALGAGLLVVPFIMNSYQKAKSIQSTIINN